MDHARVEALSNGFRLGLGQQSSVYNISPWSLDGVLFSIVSSDKSVLEPFLCPISSSPLYSVLAFPIDLFRI